MKLISPKSGIKLIRVFSHQIFIFSNICTSQHIRKFSLQVLKSQKDGGIILNLHPILNNDCKNIIKEKYLLLSQDGHLSFITSKNLIPKQRPGIGKNILNHLEIESSLSKARFFSKFFVNQTRPLTFAPERWQSGRMRRS